MHLPDGMTQQTHLDIYIYAFLCLHGVALPQTLAWYLSDQNTAHWTAYESERIVGWVTVRVDVGDGG